jgi:hypothetical protein
MRCRFFPARWGRLGWDASVDKCLVVGSTSVDRLELEAPTWRTDATKKSPRESFSPTLCPL